MAKITLPNNWQPRPYQRALWDYLEAGGTRAIEIAHRRWGKDDVLLHRAAIAAFERPATYWHCLPEFAQARKAIWAAVNPHTGKRRIDEAFPHELRASTNEQEMFIRFKNNATWQVIGSDRYNSLVGAGVAGVAFSEWALANPSAWGYIRPMMQENNGWAAFITTPRGKNHAHAMYEMAAKNPNWYAEVSSIHKTGALSPEQLSESLDEYIALYGHDIGTNLYEQEYECSFNAAIIGAFYAREMAAIRREGRITDEAEPMPELPVHRAWDIGVRDDTSIWWFQVQGTQIVICDCYSQSGAGVEHYAEIIEQKRNEHGWIDGIDFVPHDARVKEWGTGRTRVETMQSLGLNPQVVSLAGKLDGINAVRQTLPRCLFHPRTEDQGIAALEQYRREWDDDKKTFKANEVHDWSSHLCFTGDTEVLTRHGMRRIMDLPETGEVLTKCGWSRYHSPRMTRASAQLVEVTFTDGLTVRCTPDHTFLTDSGWKSAESLTNGTVIQSSLTPLRNISMAASIAYGLVRNTTQGAVQGFTGMFGRLLLAPSQRDAISTTKIATPRTTGLITSNAYQRQSTWESHGKTGKIEVKTSVSLRTHEKKRLSGTGQKKEGFGISDTLSVQRDGQSGNESRGRALIAALSSIALSVLTGISKSFAALTAKPLTIESVEPLTNRDDVWCITVPGEKSFSLSNGAVVHNCDAFRYLSMAWRETVAHVPVEKPAEIVHTVNDIVLPPIQEPMRRRR